MYIYIYINASVSTFDDSIPYPPYTIPYKFPCKY